MCAMSRNKLDKSIQAGQARRILFCRQNSDFVSLHTTLWIEAKECQMTYDLVIIIYKHKEPLFGQISWGERVA